MPILQFILIMMLTTTGINTNAAPVRDDTDKQQGVSRIGILVFDGVLTSDVTAPAEVFGAARKQTWFSSYEVLLIAVGHDKLVKTEEGLTIMADATIKDNVWVDILIVPGAYDVKPLTDNIELISYIKRTATTARWLASNCAGAFILGKAGVLDGRNATTWRGGESDLQKENPRTNVLFNKNVVIDGNLVTSVGGVVSYDAALFLLEQLATKKNAESVAKQISHIPSRSGLICKIPQKH